MSDLYLTAQEVAARDQAFEKARQDFEAHPRGQQARRRRHWLSLVGGVFAMAGMVLAVILPLLFDLGWQVVLAGVIACFFVGGATAGTGVALYQGELESFRPEAQHEAYAQLDQKNLAMLQDSQLPALIVFNREEMGRYHKIATTQATRASRQSQIAIMVGFLALVVGAIAAVRIHDDTSKILIAGLASLGGMFSAYITRTFFVAERAAVEQLYTYWKQPLSASYLLFAERVAKDLKDMNTEAAGAQLSAVIKQGLVLAAKETVPSNGPASNGHAESRKSPPVRKRATSRAAKPENDVGQPKASNGAA